MPFSCDTLEIKKTLELSRRATRAQVRGHEKYRHASLKNLYRGAGEDEYTAQLYVEKAMHCTSNSGPQPSKTVND
ncbi:unnamed protein product [Dovyalis caffra]|uniref:Uncharacterized protein n=1 Tax=Dovyalis caffra TaxID=77055 RepID=A0AAV1SPD9_9ROSI|nr:unnamed protein product [Dovyalis caffra]